MSRYNVDMAVKRTFPIHENLKLAFEANIINLTNHVTFPSPSGSVNNSGFGLLGSMPGSYNPRLVQLDARVSW
jgi:hypothetical protein